MIYSLIGKLRFQFINKPRMPRIPRNERKRLKKMPNYTIVNPDQFSRMFSSFNYRARLRP